MVKDLPAKAVMQDMAEQFWGRGKAGHHTSRVAQAAASDINMDQGTAEDTKSNS